MSALQAILYGMISVITEIIPLDRITHLNLLAKLTHWETFMHSSTHPWDHAWASLFALMFGISIILIFIHDYLAMLGSLLRGVLTGFKLRSYDDWLPFYHIATVAIAIAVSFFVKKVLAGTFTETTLSEHSFLSSVIFIAGGSLFGFLPWIAKQYTKENKDQQHSQWTEALLAGLFLGIGFSIPHIGTMTLILSLYLFRNFQLHALLRMALLPMGSLFLILGTHQFSLQVRLQHDLISQASWLSILCFMGSVFGTTWLAVQWLKQTQGRLHYLSYSIYRLIAGIALIIFLYYRPSL
jgi:undecaprenyl pyrophosphate phosphatase UppP